MNEKETGDACVALIQWFGSQKIEPEDAVLVMVKAIVVALHLGCRNCDDPQHFKKGKAIVARMIKECE